MGERYYLLGSNALLGQDGRHGEAWNLPSDDVGVHIQTSIVEGVACLGQVVAVEGGQLGRVVRQSLS